MDLYDSVKTYVPKAQKSYSKHVFFVYVEVITQETYIQKALGKR